MLRQKGIVKPCQPAVADNARSKVAADFRSYLLQDLGRSPSTAKNYVPFVDRFLMERYPNRTLDLARLRAPDVTGFVIRHAHQLSPVRAGIMVTALRSFFRYLLHRGAITTDLAGCVPTVPNWSFSTLPRFLPAAAVERLLKRCDRKTAVGRRNHAILLLLARLGVRAGEVVGLRLDDIDWSTAQITIRGKGGKSAQLPLAADVGAALASYLRHDRPRSATRWQIEIRGLFGTAALNSLPKWACWCSSLRLRTTRCVLAGKRTRRCACRSYWGSWSVRDRHSTAFSGISLTAVFGRCIPESTICTHPKSPHWQPCLAH